MGKNKPRILVLNMGGTANADWTKTKRIADPADGKTKTQVYPWRDSLGRLPGEIITYDVYGDDIDADYLEISERDSKDVTPEEMADMFATIDDAKDAGYDEIVIIGGTDRLVEWGQETENRGLSLPAVFVGAFREATRDLDASGDRFAFAPGKAMKSDFWERFLNALIHAPREPGAWIEAEGRFERARDVEKDFDNERFTRRNRAAQEPRTPKIPVAAK